MGWGVAASGSFPKPLERHLKLPVLNAAISSYGTAREMALLERLGQRGFSALVIQYCDNDFNENRVLVDEGTLKIMSASQYQQIVQDHMQTIRYRPFKHLRGFYRMASWKMPSNIVRQ
jgi:hypothetical protein